MMWVAMNQGTGWGKLTPSPVPQAGAVTLPHPVPPIAPGKPPWETQTNQNPQGTKRVKGIKGGEGGGEREG